MYADNQNQPTSQVEQFFEMFNGQPTAPPNPNSKLIQPHQLGVRPFYKKAFTGLLAVSSMCLLVTMAEKIPVIRNLVLFLYIIGILGMCVYDLVDSQVKHNYISRGNIISIIAMYVMVAIAMGFLFGLILFV